MIVLGGLENLYGGRSLSRNLVPLAMGPMGLTNNPLRYSEEKISICTDFTKSNTKKGPPEGSP